MYLLDISVIIILSNENNKQKEREEIIMKKCNYPFGFRPCTYCGEFVFYWNDHGTLYGRCPTCGNTDYCDHEKTEEDVAKRYEKFVRMNKK